MRWLFAIETSRFGSGASGNAYRRRVLEILSTGAAPRETRGGSSRQSTEPLPEDDHEDEKGDNGKAMQIQADDSSCASADGGFEEGLVNIYTWLHRGRKAPSAPSEPQQGLGRKEAVRATRSSQRVKAV